MIEFERTVGRSEVRTRYFNLSDDEGRSFGADFELEHCARVAIVDARGRITYAQMHHGNQLWGTLRHWFEDNSIEAGTTVRVRFDPAERYDGMPVVHLLPQ